MGEAATVLVLIKGLGIGGAERLVTDAAAYWDRDRFDYRVAYLLPWKDHLVSELTDLDVPVACLGDGGSLFPAAARLRHLVRTWGVDLVHAHLPWAGILARVAGGRPVVYTEHNVVGSYRPTTRLVNRLTYRANWAVTAVSDAVAASVSRYPGPPPLVVRNGVRPWSPTRTADEVRAELGLGAADRLVVHVGNIRPHKGHLILVEAATMLAEQGWGATWVSIGGEKRPGDLARVRGAAAPLGDRFRLLGRRPDARDFIAASDVYVSPAGFEGLPVSVLEAMAAARPIVATSVGGVPSLIRDGETGILVEPGDPASIADSVGLLLTDSALGAMMGMAARRLVDEEYGLEPMVRSFERIYADALAATTSKDPR